MSTNMSITEASADNLNHIACVIFSFFFFSNILFYCRKIFKIILEHFKNIKWL